MRNCFHDENWNSIYWHLKGPKLPWEWRSLTNGLKQLRRPGHQSNHDLLIRQNIFILLICGNSNWKKDIHFLLAVILSHNSCWYFHYFKFKASWQANHLSWEQIKCKFRFSYLRYDRSFPHYSQKKMEALQRGREVLTVRFFV